MYIYGINILFITNYYLKKERKNSITPCSLQNYRNAYRTCRCFWDKDYIKSVHTYIPN